MGLKPLYFILKVLLCAAVCNPRSRRTRARAAGDTWVDDLIVSCCLYQPERPGLYSSEEDQQVPCYAIIYINSICVYFLIFTPPTSSSFEHVLRRIIIKKCFVIILLQSRIKLKWKQEWSSMESNSYENWVEIEMFFGIIIMMLMTNI